MYFQHIHKKLNKSIGQNCVYGKALGQYDKNLY